MKNLRSIKETKLWKIILMYIIKPVVHFAWMYILNFHSKILYFLWFLRNREYFKMYGNDKILIENEQSFKNLANKINDFCKNEVLEKSRNFMINNNKKMKNESQTGKNLYNNDIFGMLSEDLKDDITSLAQSEKLISTAAKYLGLFPVLGKLTVYHNIPRNPEHQRGAMLWHRDDFGYKSLDLFMAITDIDENNGPLYSIKTRDELGVLSRFKNTIKNAKPGERGKILDNEFDNYVKKKGVICLKGQSGLALFIDSFTSYHKGGLCSKKDRIMLRFSYQSPDCIRLNDNLDNKYYYNQKIVKDDLNNIFLKFLFFKKSKILKFFKIDILMIKIYRILQFKFD